MGRGQAMCRLRALREFDDKSHYNLLKTRVETAGMTVDEEHLKQPKCDHHAQNRSAVLHSAVYGGPQTQQPEEADETDLGPGEEPAPLTEAFCPPERSWTSMPSWTSSIRRTSERACLWEWTFSWEQTCPVAVLASQAEHREARLAG